MDGLLKGPTVWRDCYSAKVEMFWSESATKHTNSSLNLVSQHEFLINFHLTSSFLLRRCSIWTNSSTWELWSIIMTQNDHKATDLKWLKWLETDHKAAKNWVNSHNYAPNPKTQHIACTPFVQYNMLLVCMWAWPLSHNPSRFLSINIEYLCR